MPRYIFSGKVFPERAAVTIRFPYVLDVELPAGMSRINATVLIAASQVSVVVDGEITDLETLRNYVELIVRHLVDAYGYIEGRGYDIEISSATLETGDLIVFGVEVAELQKNKTERPVSFNEIVGLLFLDPTFSAKLGVLRMALADIREAIRSPYETGFHCLRAIECLRDHFVRPEDGDETKPSWERLRDALRIDRSLLHPLERYGFPQRHGVFPSMTGQERVEMMHSTWRVIDRFIQYAQSGFQPLLEADHPLLQ
ncbi:MAG: hypothetical protein V1724_10565 [Chloroflexota bacterium]